MKGHQFSYHSLTIAYKFVKILQSTLQQNIGRKSDNWEALVDLEIKETNVWFTSFNSLPFWKKSIE